MTPSPGQVTAALDLFSRRHPPHTDLNGKHRSSHPDPTTEHIMVACGCGYRWRYGAGELVVPVAASQLRITPELAARGLLVEAKLTSSVAAAMLDDEPITVVITTKPEPQIYRSVGAKPYQRVK